MCESAAYILKGDREELVFDSVDTLEAKDNQVKMTSIFGEEKILNARVTAFSLVDHKIFLELA